jgi:hypothetical protein
MTLASSDFNGWWSRSLALLAAHWRPLALINGVAAVLSTALITPGLLHVDVMQRDLDQDNPDLSVLFAGLGWLGALTLGAALFYLVGTMLSVAVIVSREEAQGPALGAAAARIPALIGWSFVGLLLCVVAIALCIFPVLYVSAVLSILPAVVLLERGNAIGRCFRLFHADLGVSISRLATIGGLSVAAGLAAELASVILPAGTALFQGVTTFASGMVVSPMLVTTYADMRARTRQR